MFDYLTIFEQYKDIKGISDLIDDVKKLREYYSTQQYDRMQQHIRSLAAKYFTEAVAWNASHKTMPTTVQQSYFNAEYFLRLKGISILHKKGVEIQEQLSAEESAFIESINKPME